MLKIKTHGRAPEALCTQIRRQDSTGSTGVRITYCQGFKRLNLSESPGVRLTEFTKLPDASSFHPCTPDVATPEVMPL
jgi:hypothetical protein